MSNQVRMRLVLFLAVYAGLLGLTAVWAQDSQNRKVGKADSVAASTGQTAAAPASVKPKPLSENVNKGLAFLVSQQHPNGGWSQGEESAQMGHSGDQVKDIPNVADTCMATLALLRAGNTPKEGIYADNVLKAIDFICKQVEKADKDSLYVTDVRGTRDSRQARTLRGHVYRLPTVRRAERPDAGREERKASRRGPRQDDCQDPEEPAPDGTWANEGWAPILSQSIASKGLNRAAQNGFQVPQEVLARAEQYAKNNSAPSSTAVARAGGGAGAGQELAAGDGPWHLRTECRGPRFRRCALYEVGSNLTNLQDAVNTNRLLERERLVKSLTIPPRARRIATRPRRRLRRFAETEQVQKEATAVLSSVWMTSSSFRASARTAAKSSSVT